ncbi:MAG: hypothetical protein ACQETO_02705 [Pseudomonadota bacterium]
MLTKSRYKEHRLKHLLSKAVTTSASIALAGTFTLSPAIANDDPVLEQAGFEDVYASSFFRSYAAPITIAGLVLATGTAAAVTTMTAGTGAPAALAGVGSFATWVGGGGSGAYMVGLSTVGGYFGGNAILGAAVLNGVVASTVALTGSSIVGGTIAGTTYVLDGFNWITEQETRELVYLTTLKLAPEIGSVATREAVEEIIELEEEAASKRWTLPKKWKYLRPRTTTYPSLMKMVMRLHKILTN